MKTQVKLKSYKCWHVLLDIHVPVKMILNTGSHDPLRIIIDLQSPVAQNIFLYFVKKTIPLIPLNQERMYTNCLLLNSFQCFYTLTSVILVNN